MGLNLKLTLRFHGHSVSYWSLRFIRKYVRNRLALVQILMAVVVETVYILVARNLNYLVGWQAFTTKPPYKMLPHTKMKICEWITVYENVFHDAWKCGHFI